MLKGIDPRLSPALLQMLAAMGHGDEIVLADANFPADSIARATVTGQLLRFDRSVTEALEAVLTLLPLDTFDGAPAFSMAVVGDAAQIPEAVAEAQHQISAAGGQIEALERQAFYTRARRAYGIVQTTDLRLYANLILRKGVIGA